MTPTPRLFCFGLGYTARALVARLRPRGWRFAATCRDPAGRAALAAEGIEAYPFPLPDPAAALAGSSHLLSSVAPVAGRDPVLAAHGADLAALRGLAWAGYLSTTGVYGDHGGGWVDEDTPAAPGTERGRWRLAAEEGWLALGLPLHRFRLAAIYGPGRNPLVQVRDGGARRIVKPGQVFSRIRVEDIAQVLAASIDRPRPGAVYNVCDDEAAPPDMVIAGAAALLGLDPPPAEDFATATLSPMARSFYADNKRVRNDRIKRELGVVLAYPSWREGLAALAAAGEGQAGVERSCN